MLRITGNMIGLTVPVVAAALTAFAIEAVEGSAALFMEYHCVLATSLERLGCLTRPRYRIYT